MATACRTLVLAGLLVGAVAAQADDLSHPDPPDKALQQKLDLLDHGPDAPDTPLPAPDVAKGSFPHSIRIPGTDTSIRIYGQGTETLQYSR
ncbi:MAG TPA: hypothetical protein VME45_14245 [Stellaceae bacterium]|nr:hypothetical protein [Stellaceae bacterium]